MGGKFLLKLNNCERPIANKYCEGKMKRPLRKELKEPETVWREIIVDSVVPLFLACVTTSARMREASQSMFGVKNKLWRGVDNTIFM